LSLDAASVLPSGLNATTRTSVFFASSSNSRASAPVPASHSLTESR
jgi:hypothetical protein